MKKNINLDLKSIIPLVKKYSQRVSKHAPFIAIVLVLLIYVFMVIRISTFTAAEPTPEAEVAALAGTNIPKVDKKTIEQIQSLEQSSPEIQSLFDAARNNPFQE